MVWQTTPYTFALGAAAAISAGLLVVTFRSRDKRGAVPLSIVLFAATIWTAADALRYSMSSEVLKLAANDVRFLGPIISTVGVFLFAAEYTNRDKWLNRRRVAGLFGVHAVTFLLIVTDQFHSLVREGVTLVNTGDYILMEITWGPWYYVHAVYSYILLIAAVYMLVAKLRQSGDVNTYRGQTATILVATFVPWVLNGAFIAGLTEVDLTALGFTITGVMLSIGLLRYQILDLVPIARSTVVDNIDEGYLVLDTQDSIVDVNETATDIIGRDKDDAVGETFQTIFADFPSVLDRFEDAQDLREQIEIEQDGEQRFYDVDVSPIYDDRGRYTGRVVLFRDVTTQEERKQQLEAQKRQLEDQKTKLEQQNERLEDFASIVSHDLRNPINVVKSRIELVEHRYDIDAEEDFTEMTDGLERMEAIIDDVLAMARQGQTVEETEAVALSELCEEAWSNVDTLEATREFSTERTVQADRNRLLQVFENLFRNSLDHGREDVTIRVGDIDGGFSIEDDGPGIPEEDRDEVLEKGYTTHEEGTGFGLSIVQTAIEAHGWEIAVTESPEGGARFEITGVGDSPSPGTTADEQPAATESTTDD